MISRPLLLSAGLSVGLVGPSFADPAITAAWSNMRRAPSGHSRVVQSVPANAEIDLQNCDGGWCYVSWRNRFGYIPAFAVGGAGAEPPPVVAAPPAPLVVTAPPIVIGPAWGWGGPYVGGPYGWRRW